MDQFLLVIAAFLSSSLTAVLSLGGGMLLISIMSVFLPPAAVVPVHGVVQFASNASRGAFSPNDIRRDILWPFLAGFLLGTAAGTKLRYKIPEQLFLLVFKVLIALLALRMIIKAAWLA